MKNCSKELSSRTIPIFSVIFCILFSNAFAQVNSSVSLSGSGNKINTITTAVPFLLISPDSRAGGMGECGVASTPDVNSMHWNAAKYAFADKKVGVGVSYTPWLRQLVPDINLAYLAGYGKLDKNSAIAGSLRYFSLGSITFTDNVGTTIGTYRPNEFALDAAYARKLSPKLSGAMAVRFIYSNLTSGVTLSNGSTTHAGKTGAVDISMFYNDKKVEISGKNCELGFGLNISNIGAKISYTDNASARSKDFIPINMKLGSSLKINMDEVNTFAIMLDFNKLLVPTPPQYEIDSNGNPVYDANNNPVVLKGKDPHRSVTEGMFGSFNDAPGGLKEELREVIIQTGMEYWYDKQFAVRFGYFHEDKLKGNRQFFTLGAGVRYNVFGLDFAYLIPTQQRNPLQNTLRFSLTFDFDAFNKQNDSSKKE
ncbi:MAG: type IX secretion system outer membrane channel protein PorV [Bacteroidia bacterium]